MRFKVEPSYEVKLDDVGKVLIHCSEPTDNKVRIMVECKSIKSANKILNFIKKKLKSELL